MSVFSLSNLYSIAKSFAGCGQDEEEVTVRRNPKVRLADEDTDKITPDTKLRIQEGSNPAQFVSVRDYVGSPKQDSKYEGMGDPSTRLKNLLDNHQYRHASNDATVDQDGILVEPNGAVVVPLARPKVAVEVERSKVREGDAFLTADNGAILVPTGDEHRRPHYVNEIAINK